MKTKTLEFPCGDQLREAWLDSVELYAIVTELMSCLDAGTIMANDGGECSLGQAKQAKQELDNLCLKAQKVRDLITVWETWASYYQTELLSN